MRIVAVRIPDDSPPQPIPGTIPHTRTKMPRDATKGGFLFTVGVTAGVASEVPEVPAGDGIVTRTAVFDTDAAVGFIPIRILVRRRTPACSSKGSGGAPGQNRYWSISPARVAWELRKSMSASFTS